jgi:hypothetical protein
MLGNESFESVMCEPFVVIDVDSIIGVVETDVIGVDRFLFSKGFQLAHELFSQDL